MLKDERGLCGLGTEVSFCLCLPKMFPYEHAELSVRNFIAGQYAVWTMLQKAEIFCSFESGYNMNLHSVSFDWFDFCLCFHQLNLLSASVAISFMMA